MTLPRTHKRGFTLIEILLGIALMGIIILVLTGLLFLLFQAQVKHQVISEVEYQGAFIIKKITQTIHNADSISSPLPGTQGSSLSLAMISASKNPTIFDLSNSHIRITEGTGSAISLSSSRVHITNFQITHLSQSQTPGSLRIQYTISADNPANLQEYSYEKTFYATASLR